MIKYKFLPFGEGPRYYLGQRFGFLQEKLRATYVMHHYQLSVNKKTKLPIQFDCTPWAIVVEFQQDYVDVAINCLPWI
ncbi:hypothetical protein MTP99_004956 [Tenebrio molitor]|jgi:cytochrome P450|nr:hypothetical protein MTP99_004956 [Tenebrio molitor]